MNVSLRFLVAALWSMTVRAWTTPQAPPSSLSRRDWMTKLVVESSSVVVAATTTAVVIGTTASPAWAIDTAKAIEELEQSLEKMKPIPDLLQENEWDKVRTILKLPPVNKLWNLGDSQNTLLQLARETGNIDLFELKDDLAYNLQLTDQLSYDNAFVYFQPGNGKVNIKEPQELAKKAMKQIQLAIDLAKEG